MSEVLENKEVNPDELLKLKEAARKAEAANVAKSTFLKTISHDIRMPLSSMLGYLDVIAKNAMDPAIVLSSVKKARLAGSHVKSIIDDVLDMSSIENGMVNIETQPADMQLCCKEIVPLMQDMSATKNIDVAVNIFDIKHRYVYTDVLHINRVITNIFSNAIKYTPEGGKIVLSVEEIETLENNRALYRFKISDTGCGMSKDFVKLAFDSPPNENGIYTDPEDSAGLGITIAKNLVHLMGGKIYAESKLGKGTTVIMDLPFALREEGEGENSEYEEKILFALSGKKILLVEDNDFNREITAETLDDLGLLVDCCGNGKEAIDMLHRKGAEYYDAILMDIRMPVMDGYAATKRIREDFEYHVPIIALSANAFDEDIEKSRQAGMDAHQSKPLDTACLLRCILDLSVNPQAQ